MVDSYLERSRHERQVELGRLARERRETVSVMIGFSGRLKGQYLHLDYNGGISVFGILEFIRSLPSLVYRLLRRIWDPWKTEAGAGESGLGVPSISGHPRGQTPSWRDAVRRAAPVDSRSRAGLGGMAEARQGQGQGQGQGRMSVNDDRRKKAFDDIRARVDTAALARQARNLLEDRRRGVHIHHGSGGPPDAVPLPRIGKPFLGRGGGHVFYEVRFQDGVRWIAKIPTAAGPGQGETAALLCRETLRAEALLLHRLRTEARLPVPEVIDADCGDNDVGAPWLLMGFVRGRRLEDVWFGRGHGDGHGHDGRVEDANANALKERRRVILRNIADAMLRLGRYEFDSGGALVFDREHGDLVGTGPLRVLDVQAMVDRWFVDEGDCAAPVYRAAGPWERAGDMYTALLDAYPLPPGASANLRGVDGLLRLLLGYVREPGGAGGSARPPYSGMGKGKEKEEVGMKGFVLTHPDLSMRHILLAEDGATIEAILGWDGARAAPRSLGNEALPRWLVRDFDPFVCRWRPAEDFWRTGHNQPACNRFEDPPWVLRELRGYYARVMRELKMSGSGREGGGGGSRNKRHEDADVDVTKQSLLALTLDAAIRDPRGRSAALRRVLQRCSRRFEQFDFDFFVDTLGEGREIDSRTLRSLASNLRELIDKGFVRGAVVW
ncbi:hypothetical protein F4859DRAFT_510017 [Xylaria cf. heliscus]|nr:hypothetical protein F4859DRAFT_510017 [Xylaria cf. heliscus]